jgi:AhpD family alkylhydroperoxidase
VHGVTGWDRIGSAGDLLACVPDAAVAFGAVVACAEAVTPSPREVCERDAVAAAWREQFVIDVASITDDQRGALAASRGDGLFTFVATTWALDMAGRLRHALVALAGGGVGGDGDVAWPAPDGAAPGDLWPAIDAFLPVVSRLDALDPVTTELVRLRGARTTHCRLCMSLRSVDAADAGAGDVTFDAVDRYETSGDLTEHQKAALRVVDAMLWTPAAWPATVAEGVRAHFSPAAAAELVLDVVRNGANRIAVALGADEAHVTSGVEWFATEADGTLTYGLPDPTPAT